jgi:GNAT superfamily N-acetyltransferase
MIPEGYEIGAAQPHELAALETIELEAATVVPLEDLSAELRQSGLPLSFFQEAADAGRLFVARSREPREPVGFGVAILLDASAHLHEMDVLPAHARRGLGRALVERVAQWARESGYPWLTLTTFRHLAWNAPFYARLGFVEIPAKDIGPELRHALDKEAEDGLDPVKRMAMRLDLGGA